MNQILLFIVEYITDLSFVALAQVPWVCLKYFSKPYQRGFFCNDQSLMYPYRDSTVTNAMLTAINMTIPILTILIIELKLSGALQTFFSTKENDYNKLLFLKFAFKTLCIFFVGVGVNQSTTNVLKWVVGRLRPHFFSICLPSYKAPCNANLYITSAECFGTDAHKIKDARLSFPSGHASSSMYAMIFTVIFIHYRTKRCRLQTFKALIEGSLIMLSLWIGATRVSDFKHHWSDVLIGHLIGAIFGILFGSCAINGIKPLWDRILRRDRSESTSPHHNYGYFKNNNGELDNDSPSRGHHQHSCSRQYHDSRKNLSSQNGATRDDTLYNSQMAYDHNNNNSNLNVNYPGPVNLNTNNNNNNNHIGQYSPDNFKDYSRLEYFNTGNIPIPVQQIYRDSITGQPQTIAFLDDSFQNRRYNNNHNTPV